MELKRLRYFVAVAEELHFSRAARRLSISQPPLSANILKLEEELGYALLRRTTRQVALTPAGKVFYREACRILSLVDQARHLGARAADGQIGLLRLGFVGTALLTPLAGRLRSFGSAYPDLVLTVHELNSFEQIDALEREQLDFSILHDRPTPDSIATCVLHREPFVCALPADHPLAEESSIHLSRLRDESFVLFPRAFSPQYHDKIIAMCVAEGFTPQIRYEVRNNATVVSLVAAGFGIAIVPSSISRLSVPGLRFCTLAGRIGESILIGAWRRGEDEALILPLLKAVAPSAVLSTTALSGFQNL